jgi:hypothetical protein
MLQPGAAPASCGKWFGPSQNTNSLIKTKICWLMMFIDGSNFHPHVQLDFEGAPLHAPNILILCAFSFFTIENGFFSCPF